VRGADVGAGGARKRGVYAVLRLGVNVDPVAGLRAAGGGGEPDPTAAAVMAELGGAERIRVSLGPRRPASDTAAAVRPSSGPEGRIGPFSAADVERLRAVVSTVLDVAVPAEEAWIRLALSLRPDRLTLIPAGRDAFPAAREIDRTLRDARAAGAELAVVVPPDPARVERLCARGVRIVEIRASGVRARRPFHAAVELASAAAVAAGARAGAAGGIAYDDVPDLVRIDTLGELTVGHAVLARAALVGMTRAVAELRYRIHRWRAPRPEPARSLSRGPGLPPGPG